MSTGWLGRRFGMSEGSVIARHEVSTSDVQTMLSETLTLVFAQFKGLSKVNGGLEDLVEQQKAERTDRAKRRAQRMDIPGSFEPASSSEEE